MSVQEAVDQRLLFQVRLYPRVFNSLLSLRDYRQTVKHQAYAVSWLLGKFCQSCNAQLLQARAFLAALVCCHVVVVVVPVVAVLAGKGIDRAGASGTPYTMVHLYRYVSQRGCHLLICHQLSPFPHSIIPVICLTPHSRIHRMFLCRCLPTDTKTNSHQKDTLLF